MKKPPFGGLVGVWVWATKKPLGGWGKDVYMIIFASIAAIVGIPIAVSVLLLEIWILTSLLVEVVDFIDQKVNCILSKNTFKFVFVSILASLIVMAIIAVEFYILYILVR